MNELDTNPAITKIVENLNKGNTVVFEVQYANTKGKCFNCNHCFAITFKAGFIEKNKLYYGTKFNLKSCYEKVIEYVTKRVQGKYNEKILGIGFIEHCIDHPMTIEELTQFELGILGDIEKHII